ncbi:putative UDP-Gal or UDP-GlcNAc-dependent glycosyltransferase [Trypanosoma theileri]|uniref:Hexosyltransferase n=1 Tax=Trypanosoma theileri TaxID=67003 RepID=A0A1X0P6H4_9TRYP|nr:putative UDP-Gal or UDP-GlcNAc-dependent glycosyltransferase [Trypanosoma theileri]ORC92169.1 putative UDP-Gal or UDP-GlcNAc-dependent glycosyltransferase [Trypanosoma theileri]
MAYVKGFSLYNLILFAIFILSFIVLNEFLLSSSMIVGESTMEGKKRSTSTKIPNLHEVLQFIPHDVVHTWSVRDYLIVLGIPSMDIDIRRRRRQLQRSTCWKYPNVATKANNFAGSLLVLYALGRHPSNAFLFSSALKEEAKEWYDVLTLSVNDALPTTSKTIGVAGHWGLEAEVGMSRKTFVWFELSLYIFPHVYYIAKGDDDMFMRVPQFLADLYTLPRRGLYWGSFVRWESPRKKVKDKIYYAAGSCMILARDVVEEFVSYKPLQEIVHLPYQPEHVKKFLSLNMNHEDMMVGRVLRDARYNSLVVARDKQCRFHNLHSGIPVRAVTKNSLIVHHLLESDYGMLMKRFGNDTNPSPYRYKRIGHGLIMFACK